MIYNFRIYESHWVDFRSLKRYIGISKIKEFRFSTDEKANKLVVKTT
jgi:hypothetical protein